MGNLIEIQSQIEKLQKQAAEIKSREFDKTVKQILVMMDAYGITLRDLQQAGGKTSRKTASIKGKPGRPAAKKAVAQKRVRKPSATKGAKLAPKYRGPKGETWSGRGSMPRWMAELVAAGKSRESFAV
ncbi:MAG: H-NS family nucleoid-associated regulatory protein [Hylemonella sp.]|uniref:H-NS histone family protein n=1 Tax=Hylemonella sp. TaxID=2066020 RepID=UPI003918E01D